MVGDYELIGFVALAPSGFALPVYAVEHDPARLFVAYSDWPDRIDARIQAFEELPTGFEAHVVALSREETMCRRLGDLWIDILLVDGIQLIGSKTELWLDVERLPPDLLRRIPCSRRRLAEEIGAGPGSDLEDDTRTSVPYPIEDQDHDRARDGNLAKARLVATLGVVSQFEYGRS